MAIGNRANFPLRLLPKQLDRLKAAAKSRGLTANALAVELVMTGVNAIQDDDNDRRQRRRREHSDEDTRRTSTTPSGLGLGIRAALVRRNHAGAAAPDDDSAEAPSAPGVVVNVGAGASDDTVERLAAYVSNGPTFSRDTRMRHAVDVLAASCKTDDERQALATKLDDAIAKRQPPRPSSAISGLRQKIFGR